MIYCKLTSSSVIVWTVCKVHRRQLQQLLNGSEDFVLCFPRMNQLPSAQ